MVNANADENDNLVLDGNAVAGLLQAVFGREMTASPAECANCGKVAELGAALAFTQAPGTVLRCPACKEVMLRIVETPKGIIIEARGTARLEVPLV